MLCRFIQKLSDKAETHCPRLVRANSPEFCGPKPLSHAHVIIRFRPDASRSRHSCATLVCCLQAAVDRLLLFHHHKMSTTRRMQIHDAFNFNLVNLDKLTETYNMLWYYQYFATWPDYQKIVDSADGNAMAYIIGKSEGQGKEWHGHVSAVTVGPNYRRLSLATKLMDFLEETSEKSDCYFVDLFVRVSNKVAIEMYKAFGYTVYRRILEYYSGEEDAFDMRKALSRDIHKESVIPIERPVHPSELQLTV